VYHDFLADVPQVMPAKRYVLEISPLITPFDLPTGAAVVVAFGLALGNAIALRGSLTLIKRKKEIGNLHEVDADRISDTK